MEMIVTCLSIRSAALAYGTTLAADLGQAERRRDLLDRTSMLRDICSIAPRSEVSLANGRQLASRVIGGRRQTSQISAA
jgi:hypothetical protein